MQLQPRFCPKARAHEHITVRWPIAETLNCLKEVQIRGLSIRNTCDLDWVLQIH